MTSPESDTAVSPDSIQRSNRRYRLMIAGLAVIAGVVLFQNLGGFRTLGSHEGYAILPAREMLESGNWIVPRFAGLPRLRKPPLAYWVIAGSAAIFGDLNEWTARFPAALAAVSLAVLIGLWATRWYGRTAGLAAALVQMTAVYVLTYGRKAEVDMLLCLLTTGCMFLVADQPRDEPGRKRFGRWVLVYCLLSVAWLAKFHYGPAMVVAVSGAYFLVQRQFRGIWNLFNPVGLMILSAAMLIWPYLVLQQLPEAWQIWREETFGRAVGDLGTEPFWYYVPHLVVLTLPWTAFMLAAVPRSWREAWKQGDPRERFLWVWLLTQLLILTASADKHAHYLFAALPMFSLLAGRQLAVIAARINRGRMSMPTWQAVAVTAIVLGGAAIAGVSAANKWPHLAAASIGISLAAGVACCVAVWLLRLSRPGPAGLMALSAFLVCVVGTHNWVMPGRDHRQPAAQFARDTRQSLSAEQTIFAYDMGERNPVVFYLGSAVSRFESLEQVETEISASSPTMVLAYETDAASLAEMADVQTVRRMKVEPTDELRPKHPPLVLLELSARQTGQGTSRTAAAETKRAQ